MVRVHMTTNHSCVHFTDGMEINLLTAAVDATDHMISLGIIVHNCQFSQLTTKKLSQMDFTA